MATQTATASERALSKTLSGTTADLVRIEGWPYVELTNRDASVDIWFSVNPAVTTPAEGTNGSILVRAGESVIVENPCYPYDPDSTKGIYVKGNGNKYAACGFNEAV